MKTSTVELTLLVLVLGVMVLNVSAVPIFDLRPSCIFRGRSYRPGRVIPTRTCERCKCIMGHTRCHRRNC
ncbi:hypothetical protein RRG08_060427 [Elysia crispata]|uniref:Uncharacterized protein n=1 Tax=Elysia crispata TaxID=231223 RepID=A0AAE1AKZ3_9GAST|nr:hypothetical protein RRG08_060427 [Elysia crispata]